MYRYRSRSCKGLTKSCISIEIGQKLSTGTRDIVHTNNIHRNFKSKILL